jgi:hypothetical protein
MHQLTKDPEAALFPDLATPSSPERTLNDTEVSEAHAKIVAEVTKRLGGLLRYYYRKAA